MGEVRLGMGETEDQERKGRRDKLLGRLLIIGLGILLLVQMIPFVLQSLR